METELRSLLSPDQTAAYHELFRIAAQEAQQAEVLLLRKLLLRAYGVLQDVAIEAREGGETDAIVEGLMRDISIVMDKTPTLI